MPIPALALAGLIAGGQSILDAGLGAAGNVVGYNQNKSLMALKYKYAIDAFNRENARQDYLLANQGQITRNSMANAGYSAADPSGVGMMTPDTNSMQPPSNPSMSPVDFGKIDLLQAKLLQAQAENVEANTAKTVEETEGQKIQNYLNQTFGSYQWESAIKDLDASAQLKMAQKVYTEQKKLNEKNLSDAEVKEIESKVDISYKKLDPELKLLASETQELETKKLLNKAESDGVYQTIRESQQRIENLKIDLGLTDAQTSVAYQLAQNYAQEHKILGYNVTSAKVEAEMSQFGRDLERGMGLNYHRARKVAEAVLPIGVVGAALGLRLGGPSSPTPIKGFSR